MLGLGQHRKEWVKRGQALWQASGKERATLMIRSGGGRRGGVKGLSQNSLLFLTDGLSKACPEMSKEKKKTCLG